MKILITGASGFIGLRVLRRLEEKYGKENIIALSSVRIEEVNTISSKGYKFGENYLKENGCEDVNILLHIGAFIPKSTKDADNIQLTSNNINSTQKLLESKLPNLKKIIYISTLDVYEYCGGILSEESNTIPVTMYGWSKLYCEQMIIKYCLENNLDYEILRLGHVYGEGEERYKKVMPIMIRNAIQGKDLTIYGDGQAIRSFIYIDDVVNAIINSMDLQLSEIINLVGDEPVTIGELAELIREFAEGKVDVVYIPSNVENVNYVFDNTKMKKYLQPELLPLKDGLKREYDYMKEIFER